MDILKWDGMYCGSLPHCALLLITYNMKYREEIESLEKRVESLAISIDMHNKNISRIARQLIADGSDSNLVDQLVHNSSHKGQTLVKFNNCKDKVIKLKQQEQKANISLRSRKTKRLRWG